MKKDNTKRLSVQNPYVFEGTSKKSPENITLPYKVCYGIEILLWGCFAIVFFANGIRNMRFHVDLYVLFGAIIEIPCLK